jgi:DNA-binding NarL/FixJ family response regulator
MILAAWHGDEALFAALSGTHLDHTRTRGEGAGVAYIEWTRAMLFNSVSRYQDAREAAREAAAMRHPLDSGSAWGLVELVEAAARCNLVDEAHDAVAILSEATQPSGTDWASGIEARSRALIESTERAEDSYVEAVERLSSAGMKPDLARARLLYGEWLRRIRRIRDARHQLRAAHECFTGIGARAFAERAARELRATATSVMPQGTRGVRLTPQEQQIALLAARGRTNVEIASTLFLSSRTVEYHLAKVFVKLDVTSRTQLNERLATQ